MQRSRCRQFDMGGILNIDIGRDRQRTVASGVSVFPHGPAFTCSGNGSGLYLVVSVNQLRRFNTFIRALLRPFIAPGSARSSANLRMDSVQAAIEAKKKRIGESKVRCRRADCDPFIPQAALRLSSSPHAFCLPSQLLPSSLPPRLSPLDSQLPSWLRMPPHLSRDHVSLLLRCRPRCNPVAVEYPLASGSP